MLNPWIILAIVIAIGGAGVSGYAKGRHDANADAIVAQQKAVDATIAAHNADTIIDMTAAYERGQAEAKVRVVTRTIQGEAAAVTASAPLPANCRLDADRMKLLNRAVSVANGEDGK